jgi:hypothetical protein
MGFFYGGVYDFKYNIQLNRLVSIKKSFLIGVSTAFIVSLVL